MAVLQQLPFTSRRLAATCCREWFEASQQVPSLWEHVVVDDTSAAERGGTKSSCASDLNWPVVLQWLARHAHCVRRLDVAGCRHADAHGAAAACCSCCDAGASGRDQPLQQQRAPAQAGAAPLVEALRLLEPVLQELRLLLPPQRPALQLPPAGLLSALSGCRHLRVLHIGRVAGGFWPAAQLQPLAQLAQLQELVVCGTNLFLHNAAHLPHMPALKRLDALLPPQSSCGDRPVCHSHPPPHSLAAPSQPAAQAAGVAAAGAVMGAPPVAGCSPDDLLMLRVLQQVADLSALLWAQPECRRLIASAAQDQAAAQPGTSDAWQGLGPVSGVARSGGGGGGGFAAAAKRQPGIYASRSPQGWAQLQLRTLYLSLSFVCRPRQPAAACGAVLPCCGCGGRRRCCANLAPRLHLQLNHSSVDAQLALSTLLHAHGGGGGEPLNAPA